eukprot:843817-Rhodomonas_salina.1
MEVGTTVLVPQFHGGGERRSPSSLHGAGPHVRVMVANASTCLVVVMEYPRTATRHSRKALKLSQDAES